MKKSPPCPLPSPTVFVEFESTFLHLASKWPCKARTCGHPDVAHKAEGMFLKGGTYYISLPSEAPRVSSIQADGSYCELRLQRKCTSGLNLIQNTPFGQRVKFRLQHSPVCISHSESCGQIFQLAPTLSKHIVHYIIYNVEVAPTNYSLDLSCAFDTLNE